MGTTFIKLGQFLATRPDIIGSEIAKDLEKLQDKLPAFSLTEAKNILRNELGNENFLNISNLSEPVAAASIAQVHFANIKYKNENKALIKIDDEFILEDLNSLADDLVTEKTSQIQKFALENKEVICSNIETRKYHEMVELLLNFILLKEPQEHYKKQIKKIKDMIKNNN